LLFIRFLYIKILLRDILSDLYCYTKTQKTLIFSVIYKSKRYIITQRREKIKYTENQHHTYKSQREKLKFLLATWRLGDFATWRNFSVL